MHDPRVGRFFATDPLEAEYPWYTPYSFSGNKVIAFKELEGKEETWAIKNNEVVRAGPAANYYTSYEAAARALEAQKVKMSRTPTLVQDNRTYEQKKEWNNSVQIQMNAVESDKKFYANPLNMIASGVAIGVGELAMDLAVEGAMVKGIQLFKFIKNSRTGVQLTTKLTTLPIVNTSVDFASKLNARVELSFAFYKKYGFKDVKAIEHIEGIDFSLPVQTETLKKGTVVQQWVGKNGVGNYFTPLSNGKARNLGISDYDNRTLKQFVLEKDVKVLKSTAADYNGNSGGGTQYFSTELKTMSK